MRSIKILVISVLMACLAQVSKAVPMGTAFTYQGRLMDANEPADGIYEFEFKLYDSLINGSQLNGTVSFRGVDVIDGYFTVELDFGDAFKGDRLWLEVGVRPGEESDPCVYTPLSPRMEVTAAPYALYARKAAPGHSLNAVDGYPTNAVFVDDDGRVVIGPSSSSTARLHVDSNDMAYAIYTEGGNLYGI